jgi:hypothetical protein
MNVQMREHVLRTFVTHLLVHIHQKKKIALEILAKMVSVKQACIRNETYSFLVPLVLILPTLHSQMQRY